MKRATEKAVRLAETREDKDRILLYLSETPIGDEYGLLDDKDLESGREFERLCARIGVKVWSDA